MSSAPSKGRNDPRRVVINDASCLIDLRKVTLIEAMLQLPYSFVVTLPVVENELLEFEEAEWRRLETAGLAVIDLDSERVTRAFELRRLYPGLSAEDCFSLSLAERTQDCILLTGDAALRRAAAKSQVDVHGVLWVIDELIKLQVTPAKTLVGCLEKWDADTLVRLPAAEIAARIRLLTKG
jgi:predicted nucleic acid-binding protein